MIHLYLDDWRPNPKGFTLARNGEECLLLLRECEVDVLSLDYELGHGQMNGGEVVSAIISEGLRAKEIYLHTSSPSGRRVMYELLYKHMPEEVIVHNGPMPDELRAAVAKGER
ncbi:hypothetical protein JCM10914A_41450 [Paenibacillus sp. JCM 10914]|uniref:cyclic-phosphate processing receiver domain-containing protein n=1 Tax=Paenibacillus sp. JCM 10914 TaxID=1236974 RepID=UPI0003CC7C09|nr:cyclic-phosphate processing receiver domain-containing protein [Paenibacillus sp. JCM 10914]GAE05359.1 hypothetical protein JCM10914_1457 [Paenibacillus sp. JCM 10914]